MAFQLACSNLVSMHSNCICQVRVIHRTPFSSLSKKEPYSYQKKKKTIFIYLFTFCLSEISITNHDTMTQISSASSHNFLVKWCTWPLAIKLVHSEETLMMKRITKKSRYMHLYLLKFNTTSYPLFFVIYFILRYFKILSYF